MRSTLHITNGDSAANIIKTFVQSDAVLPWRDPMHHGPFPAGYSLDELSRIRIDYLSGAVPTITPESLAAIKPLENPHEFFARDTLLGQSSAYEEVVLWFEHDLLDQLQLVQLLSFYANEQSDVAVSLICIDRFEGIDDFRGIGQLPPEKMQSLYPNRVAVSQATMRFAAAYWHAFTQPNPVQLLNLCVRESNAELPFLCSAIKRYFQEFPWVSDGLTRTERQILSLVKNGVVHPTRIFVQNMDKESCLYIGDARTYSQIAQLCDANLLAVKNGLSFQHPTHDSVDFDSFKQQTLCLTENAQRVLNGNTKAFEFVIRQEWLGGVYINSEESLWCWDEDQQTFTDYST